MSGSVRQMSADDYHADLVADVPTLSASIARILIADSPKHAWTAHPKLNPDFEPLVAEKFDVGTCAHSLLLEGEASVAVIDAPDWRTNAAKEQRDEARAAGQTPLLAKDWSAVERMCEAMNGQLGALDVHPPLFCDGLPEQTLVWEQDGVTCRSRLDWLRHDWAAIDDLKTTSRSANPEGWTRTIFSMGYDVQAAFYLRGLKAVTGVEAEFRFVVVETAPPYALSVISLAPDARAIADKKLDYAIAKWKRCLHDDVWPGYPKQIAYAELPPWGEAQWLERELEESAR